MYRMYRETKNLDQNFPEILKLSQNFSLSESSRMTPEIVEEIKERDIGERKMNESEGTEEI